MAVSGNTVNTAARAIFLSATHRGRETEIVAEFVSKCGCVESVLTYTNAPTHAPP